MAQRRHVHAQLVGAARHGLQLHPRGGSILAFGGWWHGAPQGLAGLALQGVDDAQGAPLPVGGYRQVDALPGVGLLRGRAAGDHGHIALVHAALRKGFAQEALAGQAARHDHQARGGLVQPVHDQRIGPALQGAAAQAVLLVGAAPGHAQQAGGLVQHQQLGVLVQAGDTCSDICIGIGSSTSTEALLQPFSA